VIFNSLVAVFLVIALGWLLRRHIITDETGWVAFERISYFVLNPALIFGTLAMADLGAIPFLRLGGALVAPLLVLVALMLALRERIQALLRTDGPGFTSVFQGVVRWNSFVALAIAGNLLGKEGILLSAVAIAAMIPIINVISVYVLQRHGTAGGSVLKSVLTNPFVLSALGGILFNLLAIPLPAALQMSIGILGQCALGAGLILVGVGLRLDHIQRPNAALIGGTAFRLIAAPLLAFVFAKLFMLTPNAMLVALICYGVPTASGSYLLARQIGGDAPLMAAIITAQTLGAMLTLPALLWLLT
jgi:hypothetical protein